MGRTGWRQALVAGLVASAGCLGGESLGGKSGSGGTSGSGGGGGDVPGDMGSGDPCNQSHTDVPFTPLTADVLILMDRSSSMNDDGNGTSCAGGCGANSKWSMLSAAVENLVEQYPQINWGLAFYGTDNACSTGIGAAVPLGPGNAGAIVAALAATTPGGEAPTAAAYTNAVVTLENVTYGVVRYILLVTDGHSGCAGDAGSADSDALTALNQTHMPTFVLGPATGADMAASATLDQFAQSSGEATSAYGGSYYTPANIGAPFGPIASCLLLLPDVPPELTNVAVALTLTNGQELQVPEDPLNGWSFTDGNLTAIVLSGVYCAEMMDGTATSATFVYACSGPVGPVLDLP